MPSLLCEVPRLRSGFRQRAQRPLSGSTLERETGIEPATNSLEGCDSTTELLPPVQLVNRRFGEVVNSARRQFTKSLIHQFTKSPLVAREGLEPSKALGRQIYSLLRLTASLPRRCVVWICAQPASNLVCRSSERVRKLMELAKGFEPPTG